MCLGAGEILDYLFLHRLNINSSSSSVNSSGDMRKEGQSARDIAQSVRDLLATFVFSQWGCGGILLRGTIVNRTYGVHKELYI